MNLGNIFELNLFNSALFHFLDRDIEKQNKKLNSRSVNETCGDIEVKNLSFSYPLSEEYVLEDISFTIKQGETIGIVGENGLVKTAQSKCTKLTR